MPSFPLVSVVIITWNSKKYLDDCLNHLLKQSFQNFEVIIVDNGSEDDALDGVEKKYLSLDLHIHKLDTNLGFAVANNIGARLARGRWLALLNTDAFPNPSWLSNLIKATEERPTFSSFSSRQIKADEIHLLDGAGDAYHISGFAWKRYLDHPIESYGRKTEEVFSPCAAAAMYLREAFLEVGGFDEDFFSYYEDVDLGFRLRLAGYRALYVADAEVRHVGSGALGIHSDFAFYYSHRNLVWIFFANMPFPYLWLYLPVHIMTNIVYLFYYTLKGRGNVLWKAKRDAIRGLRNVFQKRKDIQMHRRVDPSELVGMMEHGWFTQFSRESRLRAIQKETRMGR
ncbi:MAG: glycosyltransferase family 2 protein [Anaerolineales bacterium]